MNKMVFVCWALIDEPPVNVALVESFEHENYEDFLKDTLKDYPGSTVLDGRCEWEEDEDF
jgi:hypothetical protein